MCFHCGESLPHGKRLTVKISGVNQAVCCHGCRAVAQFLHDNHHQDFYQFRQDKKPHEQVQELSNDYEAMDLVDSQFTQPRPDGLVRTRIKIDGMYCSACAWLINKVLNQVPGVHRVQIDTVAQSVQVDYIPSRVKLSQLYQTIAKLGYRPLQLNVEDQVSKSRKQQLKEIIVAGLGMMFIMTLSVPLYSETLLVEAPLMRRFFLMLSMVVATVVYFYAGKSFVKNALRDFKNKHLGMDVPVALSISLAYFASVYLSFKGQGHVYFDSLSMFVFFLLVGRHVEQRIKQQSLNARNALTALVPVSAVRELANGDLEDVPLRRIKKGDLLVVKAGDTLAADGVILAGHGQCNEAILTGEARPVEKIMGQRVYAGAQVIKGEFKCQVTQNNEDSLLSQMADMMAEAQSQKPKQLQLVDHIASYFVAVVLVLAVVTCVAHWWLDTGMAMTALMAVLIATCPCALSLATPTALTAAGMNLIKHGLLIHKTEAIADLSKIKHWYFDKTGTLTSSELAVVKTHDFRRSTQNKVDLQHITAYLQQASNHPIATAFPLILGAEQDPSSDQVLVKNHPGQGVSGTYDGIEYFLGSAQWLEQMGVLLPKVENSHGNTLVYLSTETQLLSVFELSSKLRPGAVALCQQLEQQGCVTNIISGDNSDAVKQCALSLNIKQYQGGLTAPQKEQIIVETEGPVAMVGDGVNDAPVLARAAVSFSLKQGADLAHAASDFIILGQSLTPISHAIRVAKTSQNIIKQNLIWALLYNLSITPAAMMGLLPPWVAAIGMSASSLLVVLNSRRVLGVS
nr:heavy metal translocating P-type ATPase [Marinicella rhabdoformis]